MQTLEEKCWNELNATYLKGMYRLENLRRRNQVTGVCGYTEPHHQYGQFIRLNDNGHIASPPRTVAMAHYLNAINEAFQIVFVDETEKLKKPTDCAPGDIGSFTNYFNCRQCERVLALTLPLVEVYNDPAKESEFVFFRESDVPDDASAFVKQFVRSLNEQRHTSVLIDFRSGPLTIEQHRSFCEVNDAGVPTRHRESLFKGNYNAYIDAVSNYHDQHEHFSLNPIEVDWKDAGLVDHEDALLCTAFGFDDKNALLDTIMQHNGTPMLEAFQRFYNEFYNKYGEDKKIQDVLDQVTTLITLRREAPANRPVREVYIRFINQLHEKFKLVTGHLRVGSSLLSSVIEVMDGTEVENSVGRYLYKTDPLRYNRAQRERTEKEMASAIAFITENGYAESLDYRPVTYGDLDKNIIVPIWSSPAVVENEPLAKEVKKETGSFSAYLEEKKADQEEEPSLRSIQPIGEVYFSELKTLLLKVKRLFVVSADPTKGKLTFTQFSWPASPFTTVSALKDPDFPVMGMGIQASTDPRSTLALVVRDTCTPIEVDKILPAPEALRQLGDEQQVNYTLDPEKAVDDTGLYLLLKKTWFTEDGNLLAEIVNPRERAYHLFGMNFGRVWPDALIPELFKHRAAIETIYNKNHKNLEAQGTLFTYAQLKRGERVPVASWAAPLWRLGIRGDVLFKAELENGNTVSFRVLPDVKRNAHPALAELNL